LSAVGLCLVQTDLDLTSKVNVESEPFKARENFYDGPVISANALRQRNGQGFFIVVINQDTETARRGTLSVPPDAAKGKMLCDLYALKPVAAPDMKASIELQPGDGRIFYCGPKAEAEKVVSDVHRNHYRNERAIYRIDEELASKNNADVSAAKAIADRAAKEETAGRFAEAHASILQAQAALAQTIKGSAALRGSLDSLQAARESLSQLTWRYSRNLGVVAPDEVWNAAQSSRVYPENKQDPQMQKLLDSTSEAFSRWSALDARVYAGEAAAVTEDAARLAADAQALLKTADELIAARKAAVQER
jgi:hypothetical protein